MSAHKEADGGWRSFVWNSEKREFLGRTWISWLKITFFYVIFYGCLAGIFVGTIQALLLTLSSYKPTYQDRVAPPGLSHTPRSEKSEISFSMKDDASITKYTESMDNFLKLYEAQRQTEQLNFEDCGAVPASYKMRGDLDSDTGVRKACSFNRDWLSACSGITDKTYGFKEGRPCLIVKLNRIVNFKPRAPLTNDSLPVPLNVNLLPIHCKNKRDEDVDKIRDIRYYGIGPNGVVAGDSGDKAGFPLQYYPYYGKRLHSQYLQPLVAIQFYNLTLNEELRIECRAFGANIDYSEKDRYQGRFDVKITINS
ncbi:sodium/potassium-transporting ATPase subunit beta-1a [Genypterus blacodes]|uniref:sodium/potassium-transporting ATPase subunit beta-1a n=1 Tax=Genypterus blacodes TaxID=154954 RepID=UPI003F7702F5